jgi:hypothetical protein
MSDLAFIGLVALLTALAIAAFGLGYSWGRVDTGLEDVRRAIDRLEATIVPTQPEPPPGEI